MGSVGPVVLLVALVDGKNVATALEKGRAPSYAGYAGGGGADRGVVQRGGRLTRVGVKASTFTTFPHGACASGPFGCAGLSWKGATADGAPLMNSAMYAGAHEFRLCPWGTAAADLEEARLYAPRTRLFKGRRSTKQGS